MPILDAIAGSFTHTKQATSDIKKLISSSNGMKYENHQRLAGDVFFHVWHNEVGHVNLISYDTAYKIDSSLAMDEIAPKKYKTILHESGVTKSHMEEDTRDGLVFRFHDENTAYTAARLAEGWADHVGYSKKDLGPATSRQIGLAFGSCHFGKGAAGRLAKYRSRPGLTPKNVTCPEMVILAFQLAMKEDQAGFIKLDAKHSSPETLIRYFIANSNHWKFVGARKGNES